MTGALTDQSMGAAIGAATTASVNTPAAVVEFQHAGESAFGWWRTGWELAQADWHPYAPSTGGIPLESVTPGALPMVEIKPLAGASAAVSDKGHHRYDQRQRRERG